MNTSFYTACRGAMTQQQQLNVISNNMANINTYGYKAKSSVFMDLMHYNMRAQAGDVTQLTAGTGAVVAHTKTNFNPAGFIESGGTFDCAIDGNGFFAVRNPVTNETSYTRNGHFSVSQRADGFYLVTDGRKLVLDANQNPIRVVNGEKQALPGVFTFNNTDGMISVGENEYLPIAKNGNPILDPGVPIVTGYLEMSNADMAEEMGKTIEASRAYSYVLKMMQTADETEQTINSLRG